MSLCVFQGTFNPIHKVHLKVAKFVKENSNFDEVLFIPAYLPPHKEVDENFAQHRYRMVELAIQDEEGFKISDIEYRRKGRSYTYLTACELKKTYKLDEKINFIIGTDAFRKIETWYEAEKLKKVLHFIVFTRENDFHCSDLENLKESGWDFEFAKMDYEDVSSSEIREKLANDEDVSALVSEKVLEYIKSNDLYKRR